VSLIASEIVVGRFKGRMNSSRCNQISSSVLHFKSSDIVIIPFIRQMVKFNSAVLRMMEEKNNKGGKDELSLSMKASIPSCRVCCGS
jgi:hypothetical protein